MKHEIINQGKYLLSITERGVYEGWAYHPTSNTVYRFGDLITSFERKVIAHLPLNGSPILEGVDLLPPLENEVDVEKKAEKHAKKMWGGYVSDVFTHNDIITDKTLGENTIHDFKSGYTQALEDNKDKKYTEEDLRKAMKYASEITNNKMKYMEDYIQSLSQPKMPIGFDLQIGVCERWLNEDCTDNCCGIPEKKITTTTPEGHTQWIGTYLYADNT